MRISKLIPALLLLSASCALPKPPLNSAPYFADCPYVTEVPDRSVLVASFRLPDCRRGGLKWTPFRPAEPFFAAQTPDGRTWFMIKEHWLTALDRQLESAPNPPLIYIHGFRSDHHDALLRARALQSLPLPGNEWPVIALTWPSYRRVAKYFWDEVNNDYSRPGAVALLRELAARNRGTVVLAHSMGNHILLDAVAGQGPKSFGHLILASPDVDRGELQRRLEAVGGLGPPATLYASRADQALSASWRSHGLPRGGDLSRWVTGKQMHYVYANARNVAIVDTSDVRADSFGHAAFIESEQGAADLCRLLSGIDVEVGRAPLGGHHWLLRRKPIKPDDCAARARQAVEVALGEAVPH